MERQTVETLAAKMDALNLWDALLPYNLGIKPAGTVIPYFCSVHKETGPVKVRLLMLEGWQTLHDFVRTRVDRNFGYYSQPIEFPHLELVVAADGTYHLYRHDTGYFPAVANERQRALAEKILWEVYGILLRLESDPKLLLKYAGEQAVFARVEGSDGTWSDAPLVIPPARTFVEKVAFPKADVKKAQDLPFAKGDVLALDFAILPHLKTKEVRPRAVYRLRGVDVATKASLIDSRISLGPETGLKELWESVPPQVLKELIRLGKVPGEIQVESGRLFRLMRPLCLELPFKLSLHDRLDVL